MSIPGIPPASTTNSNAATTAAQQSTITPSPRSYQSPSPNTPTGPSSSSSTRSKLEHIIQVCVCATARIGQYQLTLLSTRTSTPRQLK